MAKPPEPAIYDADGKIPPERFDNDLPGNPVDKSPGSLYDHVKQRITSENIKDTHEGSAHDGK